MPNGDILPNAQLCYVERTKIVDYLLNPAHRQGGSKATFFLSHGFSATRWGEFADSLVQHRRKNGVAEVTATPFGTNHAVEGPLVTASGRTVRVRTVWELKTGDNRPRLVTAYPI